MGQDSSSPTIIDDATPSKRLKSRNLTSIASYILSNECQKVTILAGAGISTSCGIPDFRSPDTGLYANLSKLNLPYAEAVFDISFFRQNPLPFYTLASELHPEKGYYKPSITHVFFKLLEQKGKLQKVFTQNIDCLEREAGLSPAKVVEAHGSFASQRCIDCKTKYSNQDMKRHIKAGTIPRCGRESCKGLIKPDIVFFGEALPMDFHTNRDLLLKSDLCIILGTSLTVQPFASLPQIIPDGVPRLLINMERVGGIGSRPNDVMLLGDCDVGIKKLADQLGWRQELDDLYKGVTGNNDGQENVDNTKTNDDLLQEGIDKLTKEIDETLERSKRLTDNVGSDLKRPDDSHISQHTIDNSTGNIRHGPDDNDMIGLTNDISNLNT